MQNFNIPYGAEAKDFYYHLYEMRNKQFLVLCDLLVHGEEGGDLIVPEQQEGGQPAFYQTLVGMKPWAKKHVNH